MISIAVKAAKKLKSIKSLFINFDYDSDKVARIKTLQTRYYHMDTKSWEVPQEDINKIIELFPDDSISIKAPAITDGVTPKRENVPSKFTVNEESINSFQFKTTPLDYQLDGIKYGLKHPKFLLADEQGLGKSKMAIDLAVMRKAEGFKHTLIICGVNGLKFNWVEEIKKHSSEKCKILGARLTRNGELDDSSVADRLADLENGCNEYFLITNIETLRSSKVVQIEKNGKLKKETIYPIQDKLKELCENGTIGMVIIDEIHKAKNPTSIQGRAIHCLNAKYKMALTGTPLMNEPIDLYNLLKWLDVENHSFYAFKKHYCIMGGFGGYEVTGYKHLEDIRKLLDSIMIRRLKRNVLTLPPKISYVRYVEMGRNQKKLYKEIKANILDNIANIKLSPNPLAMLTRLRQATGYTGVLSDTVDESAKFEAMEDIIDEAIESGQKVLVFSNWTKIINPAYDWIKSKYKGKYSFEMITGESSAIERDRSKDKFQTDPDCKVLFGTIGAMGTGLTLTAASTEIFLDDPWNMATKAQAEDRAYRIGTKGTVNIITLVCKDTIDEKIQEILKEKSDMSDALVDGDLAKLNKLELIDRLLS